jgi:sugar O-acyltransferase (sialic acid O-acetyltransferase NeuD family)
MSKPGLILVGAGGHAHACIDVIEHQGQYQIAGLVGMADEVGALHLGYSVLATDADLYELSRQYQHAFVSVGQILSPDARIKLHRRLIELGFRLPTVISPAAYVSRHATIGAGSIVMHGAVVNAGAKVGDNCIVNSQALVEHDAMVGDNCHISTGAIINGNARIGAGSHVGSGSVIREGIALGEGCMVGMGLSVRHSQASGTRFIG